MVDGILVDKCVDKGIEIRERISELLMRLSLKELFEFRYMQTDPNWSNFFYNTDTRQVSQYYNNYIILAILIESANRLYFVVNFVGLWGMQNLRESIYGQVYRSY